MKKVACLLLALAPCCLFAAVDSSEPTSQLDEGTSTSSDVTSTSFVACSGCQTHSDELNAVEPESSEGLNYEGLRYSA